MEKGDWVLILIIIIILLAVALLISNMDKLFPTPTVQQAIQQSINKT
jgi:alpha-N-acetylglucosamine transferase